MRLNSDNNALSRGSVHKQQGGIQDYVKAVFDSNSRLLFGFQGEETMMADGDFRLI